MERTILPAMEEGKIVVCDRYIPSTLIYGEVAGVNPISLKRWNDGFPEPTITIFTMPPVEVCIERVARRKETDVFEQEAFQRLVYDKYVAYANLHPEVIVVDTSGEKQETAERIWDVAGGVV